MKIACVYHPRMHSGCGKFHFVHEAFRVLGHETYHVQTMDELVRADQACDLIVHEQRGPASLCLPDLRDFLPHRKALHFQWYFDLNVFDDMLPLRKQPAVEPFLEIMQGMDAVFVKERSRLEDYKAIGVKAAWLDQGCPSVMRQAELREHPGFDVVLWGSASRPMWRQRWEDVDALIAGGFSVAWGTVDGALPIGTHRLSGCQPLDLPFLVEQAAVTLVVDARTDIPGYWSDRIWLAAGAGACIVRRAGEAGGQLPGYGYFSHESLLSLVSDLRNDFSQRRQVGEMSRRLTLNQHTYEKRCLEVIQHANRLLDQRHEESALPEMSGDKSRGDAGGRQGAEVAMPVLQ